MKNLFDKMLLASLGLNIGLGMIYLLPSILPSLDTGTKIDGDKISITKRKGLFSTVTYETSKYENGIVIYNFSGFSKSYGLTSLKDYNKDNLVDEVYFSDNPLAESSLRIERSKEKNIDFFNETDKIYQEEIKRFKEE